MPLSPWMIHLFFWRLLMDDLYKIVAVNPANSNAMQYALAYLLLAKDFNHVQSFVDTYYGTPALQYLAEPVQEALLFFSDYYHTLEEDYALRHGISNEQLSAYQQVDWEYCKAHVGRIVHIGSVCAV